MKTGYRPLSVEPTFLYANRENRVEKIEVVNIDGVQHFVIYVGVIGFILLLLYHFFSPAIKAYRQKERLAFKASEEGWYATLQSAIKTGDISSVYRHFYAWIEIVSLYKKPQTFKDIYEEYPQFREECQVFELALLEKERLKTKAYLETLAILRERLLEAKQKSVYALEKSLNP